MVVRAQGRIDLLRCTEQTKECITADDLGQNNQGATLTAGGFDQFAALEQLRR